MDVFKNKKIGYIITSLLFSLISYSQTTSVFYIEASSSKVTMPFIQLGDYLEYSGKNSELDVFLDEYHIIQFEKAFTYSMNATLQKVYIVEVEEIDFMSRLLANFSSLFVNGELTDKPQLVYTPDDYEGGGVLSYENSVFDFLGVPDAWNYTTGLNSIKIGVSDAEIDSSDLDFTNKLTVVQQSIFSSIGHGNNTAGIAVAQGDNNHGMVGVCYDCDLLSAFYSFNSILALSYAGADVVNCSWVSYNYSNYDQMAINEAYDNGTIVVGGSGNENFYDHPGDLYLYPASYDHVISVGSVSHKYDSPQENTYPNPLNSSLWVARNLKNHIGAHIGFQNNDPDGNYFIWQTSTNNLNSSVDLLAPGVDIFSYGRYKINDTIQYVGPATSPATAHVSGAIGLMLSLNNCLSFEEVETILKLSSNNIDSIPQNAPFNGNYGSGSLNVHKAVKMVYDMMAPGQTVAVENQVFSRWSFILESAPEKIKFKNEIFKEEAEAIFKAKYEIDLAENVDLNPSANGYTILQVDSGLSLCPVSNRSAMNRGGKDENIIEPISSEVDGLLLYPNPTKGKVTLISSDAIIESVKLIDMNGRQLFLKDHINSGKFELMMNYVKGIYIAVIKLNNGTVKKQKIIKN